MSRRSVNDTTGPLVRSDTPLLRTTRGAAARPCTLQKIGALPGVEVLIAPGINQGLVRFLSDDDDHDRRTDEVIHHIQTAGEAWFGGTTWNGIRVTRVSVINWQTGHALIAVAAVRDALAT